MCNLIFTLCYSRAASLQQSTIGYMCGKFKAAALGKSLFCPVSPTKPHFLPSLAFLLWLGITLRSRELFCWQRWPRAKTHLRSGWAWEVQLGLSSRQKMCGTLQPRLSPSVQEHICSPDAHINPLYHVYITDKLSPKCAEPTHNNNSRSTSTSSHPPCSSSCPHVKAPSNAF